MTKNRAVSVFCLVLFLIVSNILGACTSKEIRQAPAERPVENKATTSVPTEKTAVKETPAKPQRGGTLVYGMIGDAGELDAAYTTTGPTRAIWRLMFNSLLQTDKDGKLVPELAVSWSNPDPNTLVLNLRKGVKFHDGTDFNAEAVKFNIERLLGDPKVDPTQGTSAWARSLVTNVQSVQPVDEYTVKFNLKTPQASFLNFLALEGGGGMFSPAAVRKWGKDTVTHPVGTGPFEFVEWVKDDHITVKRFNGYWRKDEYGDPLPYLDQVIVKPIRDRSVLLTNLRTGNVDVVVEVLPEQMSLVKEDKNLKTAEYGSLLLKMPLNNAKPPFNNKSLRQAIAFAINTDQIHRVIYGGIGEAPRFETASKSWAYDPSGKFYTYDPAKAKGKLAEGGMPNGFKFVLKSQNTDLELRVAQAIKGQLSDVGIDAQIIPVEERQMGDERRAGNFEAVFMKGTNLGEDPDRIFSPNYDSKNIQNVHRYINPEVDNLLAKARVVYDETERKSLYAKAQALILEDSPVIYLHSSPTISAMNQKVMGYTPNMDYYHIQFDWVWLKK